MQTDENGETCIVSTASRDLTATEQKYSTCEQELLAIVYALNKFRIYVFGHKILLRNDNMSFFIFTKMYYNFKQNRDVGSTVTRIWHGDKSHKRYTELSDRHNQPQPCRTDTGTYQAVNKT